MPKRRPFCSVIRALILIFEKFLPTSPNTTIGSAMTNGNVRNGDAFIIGFIYGQEDDTNFTSLEKDIDMDMWASASVWEVFMNG